MRVTLSRYRFRNAFVAGGLALAGVLLVFLYVNSYRNDVQNGAETVDVFVAARDIPEGTPGSTVAGSYLKRQSVLRRNVVEGAISQPSQLTSFSAAQTILAEQQITTRQFHPAAQQGPLSRISGNERAIRISGEADRLLADVVKDGDHVDVIANIRYVVRLPSQSSGSDLRKVASRVIVRDLVVLDAPSKESGSDISGGANATITLAGTDGEEQKIVWATQNGDLWLVLRPVAKPENSPESVETIESMLTDGLGQRAIDQLTEGHGAGSINSAG